MLRLFSLRCCNAQIVKLVRRKLLSCLAFISIVHYILKLSLIQRSLLVAFVVCLSYYFPHCIHRCSFVWKLLNKEIRPERKAVFITGCDSGFGLHLAKRLATKGFQVFASCLSPHENGGKQLSSHPNVHTFRMDVKQEEDIQSAFNFVTVHLGGNDLWAVVNNAGISKGSEVEITAMTKIEEVLNVNLLGTIRVTKTFLELLRKSKGRVINVASAAGRLSMPGFVPYSTSKQAVIAFSDGLRMEMQKFDVSVITIEPWMYQTRLSDPTAVSRHVTRQWTETNSTAYCSSQYSANLGRNTNRLFSSLMNPNIDEVIDAMEDAVTTGCPPYHYRPGKWTLNASLWLLCVLPKPVADYILCEFVFKCM